MTYITLYDYLTKQRHSSLKGFARLSVYERREETSMKLMLPNKVEWEKNPSLLTALSLDKLWAPIISIVGGGGKSSTLEQLAKEYELKGEPVIVTTTTHMLPPKHWTWCKEESVEIVDRYLTEEKVLWIGLQSENGKMKSPSIEFLKRLATKKLPMVIEADGAKRLPFKVPSEWEPVILDESTMVIGVLGMDALGKPLKDMCFRHELASKLLQKYEEERITKDDYVKVICNNWGLKKGIQNRMDYVVILNKVDDEQRLKEALDIRDLLREQGINKVFLSSYLA